MDENRTIENDLNSENLPANEGFPAAEAVRQPKATSLIERLKRNPKQFAIIAAVVVVVIAAVVIFLDSSSPESVAERYCMASFTDDKAESSLLAFDWQEYLVSSYADEEEFFEEMSDYYYADIASWSDYYKAVDVSQKENLEDSYGEFKITAEATKTKDMSFNKLLEEKGSWLDSIEKNTSFDRDSISDVKLVTVKTKINGEDDTDRINWSVYVVKVGGSWKVLDYSIDYN